MADIFTSDVLTGRDTDFASFVWRCVRGLPSMSHLHNIEMWLPVELDVEPSAVHLERAKMAEQHLEVLRLLTDEQIESAHKKALSDEERMHGDYQKSRKGRMDRLEQMQSNVLEWMPEPAQMNLKNFMLRTLESALTYEHRAQPEQTVNRDPHQWRKQTLLALSRRAKWAREEYKHKVTMCHERTEYLKGLAAQIPQPPYKPPPKAEK